jgi:hypothetical protein
MSRNCCTCQDFLLQPLRCAAVEMIQAVDRGWKPVGCKCLRIRSDGGNLLRGRGLWFKSRIAQLPYVREIIKTLSCILHRDIY